MSQLSQSLACLQILPYHSKSFRPGAPLKKLPSFQVMFAYVRDVLIPKARGGKVTIIATRGIKYWRLPDHGNIVAYQSYESRNASLSLKSRGGKAIAQHFGLSTF